MKDWYTIGEFARTTGLTAKALRLYEEKGLLQSHTRGTNSYRYYRHEQIAPARRIRELKGLGFTLAEVKVLLSAELDTAKLISAFENRLRAVSQGARELEQRKAQLETLLASLKKDKPLNQEERRTVMKHYEDICIVVTGIEDLEKTAEQIAARLKGAGRDVPVTRWGAAHGRPCVLILPERELNDERVRELRPDVVVVRGVSEASPAVLNSYLSLYGSVGPEMATVFHAEDRASLELAAQAVVQRGKIFYFSKNAGVEDQIRQIGGIVSDGEDVRVYGFNARVFGPNKAAPLKWTLGDILPLRDELALISSLTAVLDVGLDETFFAGG